MRRMRATSESSLAPMASDGASPFNRSTASYARPYSPRFSSVRSMRPSQQCSRSIRMRQEATKSPSDKRTASQPGFARDSRKSRVAERGSVHVPRSLQAATMVRWSRSSPATARPAEGIRPSWAFSPRLTPVSRRGGSEDAHQQSCNKPDDCELPDQMHKNPDESFGHIV